MTGRARLAPAAGWLLAGGMSVAAAVRLARRESHPMFVAVRAAVFWLLLPAYPLAAAAAAGRRRGLAAVATALALGHAGWASGAVCWGRPRPAPPGSTTVRLLTANLFAGNADLWALAGELRESGGDVLVLQELTAPHLAVLRAAGLLERYPHTVLDPRPGYHGSAILSRLPVDGRTARVAGHPVSVADVHTAAGPLRVVNVHPAAPVSRERIVRWRAQRAGLRQLRPADGRPFVLAGDFNATTAHRPLAELIASGLRDSFREAGRGLGATWPQWRRPAVPLMRLDHVLVSGAVTVVGVDVQRCRGSDHRRLVADLAIAPCPDLAVRGF